MIQPRSEQSNQGSAPFGQYAAPVGCVLAVPKSVPAGLLAIIGGRGRQGGVERVRRYQGQSRSGCLQLRIPGGGQQRQLDVEHGRQKRQDQRAKGEQEVALHWWL